MAEERQGILDFLEPVLSGTAAFGNYYANKRSDQKKIERYKAMEGLLNQYGMGSQTASGMQSPATSAPQRGPQGLIGGGQQGNGGYLPPQFYQQAGILSGNEQFLSQDQVGGQNMQRQMQAQQNEQQFMSAAQAAQLEQSQAQYQGVSGNQQAQLAQQQAQYENTFGGISEYQKAVLQNDADKIAATANAPAKAPTGYQYNPAGTGLMAIPGGKEDERQLLAVAPIDTALETIDRALEFLQQKGSYEAGIESKTMSAELKQDIVSGLQAATSAGTLGESEANRLASQGWDFNALGNMFSQDETAEAKLKALKASMTRQRDKTYKAQGKSAPASKVPPVP